MPLLPGKKNVGHNIEVEQAAGKPHEQAIAIALNVARKKRADGGYIQHPRVRKFHSGPIHSSVAGRTDHLPINVSSGSYVIPADIISGMGEGNTIAGFQHARRMFGGMPYGGNSHVYGQSHGVYGMMSSGGATDSEDPGVPIVAAGGEYVLSPEQVREAGGGDLDRGHRVLDAWILHMRKELVNTLKKLPPPKKD